jgi:hypothetical protein
MVFAGENGIAWQQATAMTCPQLAKSPSNTDRQCCFHRKTAAFGMEKASVKHFSVQKM